jgi:hypothetical protein
MLDEMQWMAKEFASERKLKLKQCRNIALKASRSKLDVASRAEVSILSICAREAVIHADVINHHHGPADHVPAGPTHYGDAIVYSLQIQDLSPIFYSFAAYCTNWANTVWSDCQKIQSKRGE